MATADDDKPLAFFSADTGCTVYEIATTFEKQSDESRENLWKKLIDKPELTTFVDVYTVIMGLIAMTLKAKDDTSRPPQNAIKSLTKQLIPKLPKNSNDEPILSKNEFLQNIHNILYNIHFEFTDDEPRNKPQDDYTTLDMEGNTQQTLMTKTEPTSNENINTGETTEYAPGELVPMDEIEPVQHTPKKQEISIAKDITNKLDGISDCICAGKDNICDNIIVDFFKGHAATLGCLLCIGAIVACIFGSIRLQDAETFKNATEAKCTYVITIKQTCKFWPDSDDTPTTINPFEKSDGIIATYIYNSSMCRVEQSLIDTLETKSGTNYDKLLRENKVLYEKSQDECDEERDGKDAHTSKTDTCHINSCGGDNFTWSSAEEHYQLGVVLMIVFAVCIICCCVLWGYYFTQN
eukprot:133065_1